MQHSKSDHLFMDISTIEYRDTNISFSVENILNNQYYSSSSLRPQQKTDQNKQKEKTQKSTLHKNKKEQPPIPKTMRKDTDKGGKHEVKEASKHRDAIEERETEDNSETVKIVHCKSHAKDLPLKKLGKQLEACHPVHSQLPSNKFQPVINARSRTKSNASLTAQRKVSQMSKEDFNGHAASSNISLKRNQSQTRLRSETNKGNAQQIKMKNQNIVRNDYFEEIGTKGKLAAKGGLGVNNIRQRQISSSKKLIVPSKKSKKTVAGMSQGEKFNPKSPRLVKK